MLDLENVKSTLQSALNDRENAFEDFKKYRNDTYESIYEKNYIKYRSRFNGMCDILFEIGYLVFVDDYNSIRVEKRRDDNLTVD